MFEVWIKRNDNWRLSAAIGYQSTYLQDILISLYNDKSVQQLKVIKC
jgi:hypothetical protein